MNEKLGITTAVGLFGLLVATIYLITYWGSFSFDIFQFAGLTDFAKLAIQPLAVAMLGFVLGMTITAVLVPAERLSRVQPLRWPPPTTLRIIPAVSVLGIILVQTLVHAQWRWPVTAVLLCPAASMMSFHPGVHRLMPGYLLRMNSVLVLLLLPVFAAAIGSLHAKMVKDGTTTLIVDNTGVAANLKSTPEHPLTYVGFVSDTFVIYETATGNLILLKQSDTAPLVLKPNPKAHSSLRLSDLLE
ncbi:hypothetical protein CI15_07640 [Paraburkholderia monticola]|uniref:Uncharacterized protein n=1 Tax=Paraburkholderia monticola TaxID=1399968 RepID=A0A149PYF5_9BURK|nr:hypothetical protein [Paraburkholderia monticola]KXU90033.1 hypothetical protein CI15_07640 [Paraburkholderia monticola]